MEGVSTVLLTCVFYRHWEKQLTSICSVELRFLSNFNRKSSVRGGSHRTQ